MTQHLIGITILTVYQKNEYNPYATVVTTIAAMTTMQIIAYNLRLFCGSIHVLLLLVQSKLLKVAIVFMEFGFKVDSSDA
jgi:hypothetical protein